MIHPSILDKKTCRQIAQILSHILADTYLLYIKTQNFHWNLIDPRFYALHKFFEEQYQELAKAIDVIAERIRMLGERAPGSIKEFLDLGSLEESSHSLSGNEMLQQLLHDHTAIIKHIRPQIDHATDLADHGTADMLIGRIRAHEKAAWMLDSHK